MNRAEKLKILFISIFYVSLFLIGFKFSFLLAALILFAIISYGSYIYVEFLEDLKKKEIKNEF